ncbi:MAG: cryptochrome/photolyase family protein [Tenacibaculum sp.]
MKKIAIFWFRRDLRLEDNIGLFKALNSSNPVLPIFIFDEQITSKLPRDDARINFIYNSLKELDRQLKKNGSSLLVLKGKPLEVWKNLTKNFEIEQVFFNRDYEPYAIERDTKITDFLKSKSICFFSFKDQVIFEKYEVLKKDNTPYTVFSPYKKQWLHLFDKAEHTHFYNCQKHLLKAFKIQIKFPDLMQLGFTASNVKTKPFNMSDLALYEQIRNYPALNKTSNLSPYLRFGQISIRQTVKKALLYSPSFLSQLIWREFFMQILYHFPRVVSQCFKPQYETVKWINNKDEFELWCKGKTGYPLVDAGMIQLNTTGYMHNRVRMLTASFLCKHLLINWRWGEAYFAQKLLDYDLASNNGNWQWAAGTGCDAVPYFRIFNPNEQLKKFDSDFKYTKKWISNLNELSYPKPIVEHKFARERAINAFKKASENC